MEADNVTDWRTLVDTFVNRNGNINFDSPVLRRTNEEDSESLDSSMIVDCAHNQSGGGTSRKNWRQNQFNDSSLSHIPYSLLSHSSPLSHSSVSHSPALHSSLSHSSSTAYSSLNDDIGRYSYAGSDSEMVASSFSDSDDTSGVNSVLSSTDSATSGPPPPKRLKAHRTSTFSWSLRTQDTRNEILQGEYSDLGVVPLGEEFCPRASSTPISSPTIAHVLRDCEGVDFWTEIQNYSNARRRLSFRNEDAEAVFHLVTKYNLDDENTDEWRCN